MRDLCRTRGDMVEDLTRARNRLLKFLLRHSRIWRGGSALDASNTRRGWPLQRFDEPALQTTFEHYRAVVFTRDAQLAAVEADLTLWILNSRRSPTPVRRLAAYRGVTALGALGLQAEVCDWRRFGRAAQMMGFVGLVPTEYSSGRPHPPGPYHQGRQRPSPSPTGRGRLGLSAPPLCRPRDRQTPRRAAPRGDRPGLGRPAAPVPAGSGIWPPARTPNRSSPPRWPENSPGSCGRR